MNRLDYSQLLAEIEQELTMPGGNFDALFGHDPKTLEQARFAAAVALTAADRLYSRLTLQDFKLRERDEHPGQNGK
ncbi:MAG: hypothetical protein Q4F17_01460 [Eubacteriales bacterium]|nr:hypothetical protein [Eubacteriales bacterium]